MEGRRRGEWQRWRGNGKGREEERSVELLQLIIVIVHAD